MGQRTGRPRGRPKGAKNKRTREREAAMTATADKVKASIKGAFDGDAHALLMSIYKDPKCSIELRIDAAKAALRVEKPSLSAVAAHIKDSENPYDQLLALVSDKSRGLPAEASLRARQRAGKGQSP